jgi:hypothetical protein
MEHRLSGAVNGDTRQIVDHGPKGTWGNRPESSLRSIFLLWLPQTNATLDQRLKVIDCLLRTVPDAAWSLMIDILPKSMDSSSYNPKPRWRDFSEGESVHFGVLIHRH